MGSEWKGHFSGVPGYLDTASVGIPPLSAVEPMRAVLNDWQRGQLSVLEFDDHVARARAAWARISGIPTDWVAVGANVSSLTGLVASSLPDGANVLLARGEFTSLLFPFLMHAGRGVRVREVELCELIDSVDDRVDLVVVSSVQSSSGRTIDVECLAQTARAHASRVLLDVTHASGWLPTDLTLVDYAVCAAYKWLLCPRGVAFMSVQPARLPSIAPLLAGWYAGDNPWTSIYGSPLRLAEGSRRLDTSPAWFSWVGASYALELLAELPREAIRLHNVSLANEFLEKLGQDHQNSAIVTIDDQDAADRLLASGVRVSSRAGRVRLSFHLYNSEEDVQMAVAAVAGTKGG